jgi:rod shape-determining protein MreC
VLLLAAVTFIVLDLRGGSGSIPERMRTGAATVFGPVERAASAIVRPISRWVDGLTSIGSSQQRIDELEAENDRLTLQLRTSEVDRNRAQELDDLLNVAGLGRYRIVPAQVTAVGSARGFVRTVTIDAGARDGLKTDMTVLNGQGLVGRVTSVGATSATVLLLPDPRFTVGARLAGSMEIGAVSGQGTDPVNVTIFNPQADLNLGDALVTLGGADSPFVPGVPIGEVYQIESTPGALTRSALVKPYVSFTSLDLVGVVVQPPRRNPRDSVLPPSPSPTSLPSPSTTSGTPSPGASSGSPSPGASPS